MQQLLDTAPPEDVTSALVIAAKYNRERIVKLICLQRGADIDISCALPWLAVHGNASLLLWLLQQGADPASCQSEAFRTALFCGKEAVAKVLLQSGADPTAKEAQALTIALIFDEKVDVISKLLDKVDNISPLHIETACRYASADVLDLFLSHINFSQVDVRELLLYAAQTSHTSNIKLLVRKYHVDLAVCSDELRATAELLNNVELLTFLAANGV